MPAGAKCSSCGASMIWARTVNGKMIPLDAQPNDRGNVVLQDGVALVLGPAGLFDADGPRYMPHHATCPNAHQYRKKSP